MAQISAKQVKGLQSTLDAITGIDKISETFTTTATDGDTGILITQPVRETDAIQVFVNGQKLQEGYSWKKDGVVVTATSLEAGTELVWSSSIIGYDLDSADEIQIEYETLTSGNTLQGNSGISGTVTGNLIPDTNEAYDLGSPDKKFKDIYMSGNTLYMGGQPLSIVNGQLTLNGNPITGSVDVYNSTKASEGQLTSSTILSTTNTGNYQNLGGVLSPNLNRFLTLDGDVIKVFRLTNNTWQQEGSDIHGTLSNITFNGGTRKWSKDGTHFIIVSPQNGSYTLATVYYWDGSDWVIKGNQIDSDTKNGDIATFPEGLDINYDGTRIAIQWDLPSGTSADVDEFVTIYDYNSVNNNWDKRNQMLMPSKYFSLDNEGEYMILDEDSSYSSSRRMFIGKIHGTNSVDFYQFANFAQVYSGNPNNFTYNSNNYSSIGPNRRGEFSGNGDIVSFVTQPYDVTFMIKVPTTNQQQWSPDNWWVSSTLDASTLSPLPAYIFSFNHNEDGTRTMIHHVSGGVNYWSIWDRSGNVGSYTWTKILGPISSASSSGFSANADLTKVMSEISIDNHVLYNIPAALPINSVSANRILDTTTLSVGSQFELQFDEGLAYAAVQTCHVYIDYNNRIHARVVSNDANTNTLTLEVIELVGGGISDEYTITLG